MINQRAQPNETYISLLGLFFSLLTFVIVCIVFIFFYHNYLPASTANLPIYLSL